MGDEETKACPNCKREIPTVNFTIHSVHCARNIKVCPVCKEPVPGPELNDHHQKMHKLLPCKQCGESICGTDLEDHIRDSCANTVKTCRFCELELPRRELPTHEGYCGTRTEQCPDCKEYIMIKYHQLHLDSNHGFIRLDYDPSPKKEPPKLNLARPMPKSNLNRPTAPSNGPIPDNIAQRPASIFDDFNIPDSNLPTSSHFANPSSSHVKNRQTPSNSELTPSTFGNPRPYVRPSSSYTESPPFDSRSTSYNSTDSADPKPSSSNVRPNSSNVRPDSSNVRPDSSNARPTNDRQVTSNFKSIQTSPESFNVRLGLTFANPLPLQSPSHAGSDSLYSGPGSSNTAAGSSYAAPDSSNARSGSSNARPGSSNARPGSSNFEPSSSNARLGSSNARPGSSNARPGSSNFEQSPSNARPSNFDIAGHSSILSNTNNIRNIKKTELKNQGSHYTGGSSSNISPQEATSVARPTNGVKKRTNDQPQINMDTSATKTVDKDLGAASRGAVKKRPAPPPPPPRSDRRDLPFYSALQRQQNEERQRRDQNEYNLAHGLPPVLNPAQKIEKLRKLDALQNRDYEAEYRSRQRRPSPEQPYRHPEQDYQGHRLGSYQDMDEATRQEFKNLKPMSPTQFMKRFSSLQVSPSRAGDRFPEIRSSLRELRRGLNEVTAPYNSINNIIPNNNNDRVRSPSPIYHDENIHLPCEFCNMLVPADDLVQHQTGCRPDLVQLQGVAAGGGAEAAGVTLPSGFASLDPVIPCEFCMESLPVYLIIEHQERCSQENMAV